MCNGLYSWDCATETVSKFEQILNKHNCPKRANDKWPDAGLASLGIVAKYQCRAEIDDAEDFRDEYRLAVGILDLMHRIIRTDEAGHLGPFAGHLKLFRDGSLIQSMRTPKDNKKTKKEQEKQKDADRKGFELYFGLLVAEIATDLSVESPTKSSGKNANPDIIATIDGKRWGFALKAPDSAQPRTWLDNFQKGASQTDIEGVDRGVVVFSLRSLLQQDDFMRGRSRDDGVFAVDSFKEFSYAECMLQAAVDEIRDQFYAVDDHRFCQIVKQHAEHVVPCPLAVAQTTIILSVGGGRVPVTLGQCSIWPREYDVPRELQAVAEGLQAAARAT